MKSILLILALIISLSFTGNVFAEERVCIEGQICVFPGDFLIYSGNQVEEFSYFFEDFTDIDKIQYTHKSSNENETIEQKYILDLKNGDIFDMNNPNEAQSSFVMISTIPIQIDQFSSETSKEKYSFKNMERSVWVVNPEVEGGTSKIVLDEQTGIVLEMNINVESEIDGQPFNFELINRLTDTNIFDESTDVTFSKPLPVEEIIPDWVRNTALWWSDDMISDEEFVNGIQFLINEGIIQVSSEPKSNGNSSQAIPDWIKNTAGWWATNQVSDKEFLNGIKWLIEEGILRI